MKWAPYAWLAPLGLLGAAVVAAAVLAVLLLLVPWPGDGVAWRPLWCAEAGVYEAFAAAGVTHEAVARGVVNVGSGAALRRVLARAAHEKRALKVAMIGGSVSYNSPEHNHGTVFVDWLNEVFPVSDDSDSDSRDDSDANANANDDDASSSSSHGADSSGSSSRGRRGHTLVNGALGSTGSMYFRYCTHAHIGTDADIVLLDLAANDGKDPTTTAAATMESHAHDAAPDPLADEEAIIRAILRQRNKPAIILVGFTNMKWRFANSGEHRLAMLARFYDLVAVSYAQTIFAMHTDKRVNRKTAFKTFMGDVIGADTLHPTALGYTLAGNLIVHTVQRHVLQCRERAPLRDWHIRGVQAAEEGIESALAHAHGGVLADDNRFTVAGGVGKRLPRLRDPPPVCLSTTTHPPTLPASQVRGDWALVQFKTSERARERLAWRSATPGNASLIVFPLPPSSSSAGHADGDGGRGRDADVERAVILYSSSLPMHTASLWCWIDDAEADAKRIPGSKARFWKGRRTLLGTLRGPAREHSVSCAHEAGATVVIVAIFVVVQ